MLSREVVSLTSLLCITGCANDLLSKILANVYGFRFAFFVDQSCNLLYCILAALVPLFRQRFRSGASVSQRKLATMGLLDAVGTLMSSIGNVGTPGKFQGALSQTLIPTTMAVSKLKLGNQYSLGELGAAGVVLFGATVAVVGPLIFESTDEKTDGGVSLSVTSLPCIALFFLANLPMALSNVYKETGFRDHHIDVWEMTAITTAYQTIVSFPLAVLQLVFSGDPSRDYRGYSFAELNQNFVQGAWFSLGVPGMILVGYCAVNMGFNVLGLLVTKAGAKHGFGSVLCSMAYAVKLPVSSLLFGCSFLMGEFTERVSWYTVSGVLAVTAGFVLYVKEAEKAVKSRAPSPAAELVVEEPWAFHERVVGCVSTHVVCSNTDMTSASCYHRLIDR